MERRVTKMATSAAPVEIGPGSRRFRGVASTSALDRDLDRVLAWNTDDFRQNPTLLWNHQLDEPIGKVTDLTERGGQLEVTFELLPEGVSERADFAYAALRHGTVRALSVGFTSTDYTFNAEGGRDFQSVVVYEISLTPVPANPQALAANLGGKRGRVVSHEPDRPRPVTTARIEAAVEQYVKREVRSFWLRHTGRLD